MSQTDLFDMEWYTEDGKNEIKIDAPSLFQEIERELKSYILEEQLEGDSTDGPIQLTENVTNKIQEDFDDIIGDSIEKKNFIKSLTRTFAILLNTKIDSVEKIKKIIKIAINTALKLWSEQN